MSVNLKDLLFDQIQIEFSKHKSVKHNLDYLFINVTRQNIHAWVHKRPHKNKDTHTEFHEENSLLLIQLIVSQAFISFKKNSTVTTRFIQIQS